MRQALNHSLNWTSTFIVTCVVGFIFQNITSLWIYLAFYPRVAFRAPWMFITSIFLHADLSHLFFNIVALLFFGTSLERLIGRRVFPILFLSSGVIGNIGYLITDPASRIPAIGASGAIYGVIGALATLQPFALVFIYGFLPLPLIVAAALWVLLDLVGLFAPSEVAHGAHLGGMVVGVLFGVYYRILFSRVRSPAEDWTNGA